MMKHIDAILRDTCERMNADATDTSEGRIEFSHDVDYNNMHGGQDVYMNVDRVKRTTVPTTGVRRFFGAEREMVEKTPIAFFEDVTKPYNPIQVFKASFLDANRFVLLLGLQKRTIENYFLKSEHVPIGFECMGIPDGFSSEMESFIASVESKTGEKLGYKIKIKEGDFKIPGSNPREFTIVPGSFSYKLSRQDGQPYGRLLFNNGSWVLTQTEGSLKELSDVVAQDISKRS